MTAQHAHLGRWENGTLTGPVGFVPAIVLWSSAELVSEATLARGPQDANDAPVNARERGEEEERGGDFHPPRDTEGEEGPEEEGLAVDDRARRGGDTFNPNGPPYGPRNDSMLDTMGTPTDPPSLTLSGTGTLVGPLVGTLSGDAEGLVRDAVTGPLIGPLVGILRGEGQSFLPLSVAAVCVGFGCRGEDEEERTDPVGLPGRAVGEVSGNSACACSAGRIAPGDASISKEEM